MTGRPDTSYIWKMVLPALPLIVVGAAGLAIGWLGREWVRRRGEPDAGVASADATGEGRAFKAERPARTLAWCAACHAHMAAGHRCMGAIADPGTIARSGRG